MNRATFGCIAVLLLTLAGCGDRSVFGLGAHDAAAVDAHSEDATFALGY